MPQPKHSTPNTALNRQTEGRDSTQPVGVMTNNTGSASKNEVNILLSDKLLIFEIYEIFLSFERNC